MNNPIYTSSFKDHIKSYVELKQAIGYKFNTEAQRWSLQFGQINKL